MTTIEEKIKALEEKLKQEKAKKAKMEARKRSIELKQTRQEETRKKVLLGAFLLDKYEGNISEIVVGGVPFSNWLTRDDDRKLFDLAPLPKPASSETPPQTPPQTVTTG